MLIGTPKRLANYKHLEDEFKLDIDGENVEIVSKFKYLGIWIDNKLNWESHLDYMCSKISQRLGVLKRVRPYINLDTAKMLYNATVLPIMEYNCVIWSNCTR